jgi:hypothetical protein
LATSRRRWIGSSLFLLLALLSSACNLTAPKAASEPPTLVAPTEAVQGTPAAALEPQVYTNEDFGFSFSYPAGYEVQRSFPHNLVFLAPQSTSGQRERGWLTVERAAEDNAEWYAKNAKAENANFGVEVGIAGQVLDGEQAYILGRVPGQDLTRQVFVVHDGILYHLTFTPDDPAAGEAYQQVESLYTAILGSLRFLPAHQAARRAPVIEMSNMSHHLELAINARSTDEMSRLMSDEFVLGTLDPSTAEGVTSAWLGQTDAVAVILKDQLSHAPAVTLQRDVDWASVPGSLDSYAGFFPGQTVTPILAKGWGPSGSGQAVIIIARRIDSSLFWSGVFVLQGVTP